MSEMRLYGMVPLRIRLRVPGTSTYPGQVRDGSQDLPWVASFKTGNAMVMFMFHTEKRVNET